jgi:hypothetical protein
MRFIPGLLGSLVIYSTAVHGRPLAEQADCPAFTNGTITVNQFQLYPENADWDTKNCLVYFGLVSQPHVFWYDARANTFSPP